MKRTLLLSALVLLAGLSYAQDKKAKEVLDQTSNVLVKANCISIDFLMNIKEPAGGVNESFAGQMQVKGNKFHIDTPDTEVWFDGEIQSTLYKDWEEVNISEISEEEARVSNPFALIEVYRQNSKLRFLGEKKDAKGRSVNEVELLPSGKTGEIAKLILEVNTKDHLPYRVYILYQNGIENIIHIERYTTGTTLPDSIFAFDKKKYPQVEINDLR